MKITPYHAKYFAYELTRKCAADDIQKLASTMVDAQIDLNPHQVDAALFAFKSPLSKGAILADEVGLGKTIEAGLVISQKWAERRRKILIITPATLRKQWSQELIDKFYLPSIILEKKSFDNLKNKGNNFPFEQTDSIVICSYEFAAKMSAEVRKTPWDLVVIDEAHKLRNVHNASNKRANAIKNALSSKQKILLTATPLQNNLLDVFGMVSVIDEYIFGDKKSFSLQYVGNRINNNALYEELRERLKPVCKRTLRKDVTQFVRYTNRKAIVEPYTPKEDEQKLYEGVTKYLQTEVLYALPNSQRKLITLILRKLLASSSFAIAKTLESLRLRLEEIIKGNTPATIEDTLTNIDDDINFDENAAACNENLTNEEADSITDEEENNALQYDNEQIATIKAECAELKKLENLAKSITVNNKGTKLLKALSVAFEVATRENETGQRAAKKAIIFTESRRTQSYIKELLEKNGYEGKIVLFDGSNSSKESNAIYSKWIEKHNGSSKITGSKTADMRQALVEHFRDNAEIMIATEAAAEGINLQFCSLVINYDLPWNPQRIEQRIGRCHRYGQQFDVVVLNFKNMNNAADLRIHELLQEKFQLFGSIFGSTDDVLGQNSKVKMVHFEHNDLRGGVDLPRTIDHFDNFESRIAEIYQNCRTDDEIKDAFDSLTREMEVEINEVKQTAKQQLLDNFDHDVAAKFRNTLKESENCLNQYQRRLLELTFFALEGKAQKVDDYTFQLTENPFHDEKILTGRYQLAKKEDFKDQTSNVRIYRAADYDNNSKVYRTSHPLAEIIIANAKQQDLPVKEVVFDYSNTTGKISVVEELQGKSGWMQVQLLTVESFEKEEHFAFAGFTDGGDEIHPETLEKFFLLSATDDDTLSLPLDISKKLKEQYLKEKEHLLEENMTRNEKYFDDEMDKLDHWADNMKEGLVKEIDDIREEIKLKKAEARRDPLAEKITIQRIIKELENRQMQKKKNLYEAQDEIDGKKENLLSEVEKGLEQRTEENVLFTIKWKIL
jgi:superfamily II DNA/RNA helicase